MNEWALKLLAGEEGNLPVDLLASSDWVTHFFLIRISLRLAHLTSPYFAYPPGIDHDPNLQKLQNPDGFVCPTRMASVGPDFLRYLPDRPNIPRISAGERNVE